MKSEPNLAEKLCVENTLRETNLCAKNQVCVKMESWKRTLRLNVVLFIKFRKYKTAFNSGLKIWLVSGIFEMAQLFNLKFCVYLCWLGAGFSPQFSSRETLYTIYFPNLRWKLLSYFFKKIYWNCYRKILCENWKPNQLCR